MEDGRWRKRRRLDQPETTKTTLNKSDTLACAIRDGDLGFYGASNIHSNGVASEAALTDTGDSGRATLVCYGMLENLSIVSIPTAVIIDNPTLDSAYLDENGMIQRSSDGAYVGKLEDKALQCLSKLHNEDIKTQFMLKTVECHSYRKRVIRPVALASVIIYGPGDMGDDVGDFLDRCNYVLQDPFGCKHNVPYMNPHCLSTLFESPRMTFELHSPDSGHNAFTLSNSLHALETIEHLPEWPQPVALKTELHRHQKQALWFFLMRERPDNLKHIWQTMTLTDGSLTYVNEITGSYQNIPPPVWNGGILADEMGLGKTLQMISLIVAGREIQQQEQGPHYSSIANSHMATLVVVPLPLISVWEDQFNRHLRPSTLLWERHHGRSRLTGHRNSACPDVVLTTYQTVQAEHKRSFTGDSILFGRQWRRIILDEAHIIRNKTSTSSAISALKAVSRWAITGTPIQNSFADIGGLLRFLRFSPYDDGKSFDKDIIDFFRKENIEEGVRRLKALCRPIMIRRPMSVVVLPTRQDLIKTVEFSAEERREYLKIENSLQELSSDVVSYSEAHLSMSTIQLINKLRLYCNLGACPTTTTPDVSEQTVVTTPESQSPIETVVASEMALGGTDCEECRQIIDIPDISSNADISPYAYSCECCKLYCSVCAALGDNQTTKGFSSCTKSPCMLRPLFPEMVQKARNDQPPPDLYHAETSKIRALVQGVLSCLPEKNVVFSFWTSSLTMAQKALTVAGIRCVRIDGSVPPLQREQTIRKFQADEEIKVILVTISCGGVGLDLTAASRVHLLEPQWNPAIEEQALSRVHRMGQRRPVVAIRHMMKDSIEESVASVKGKKQLLSELLPQAAHTQHLGSE